MVVTRPYKARMAIELDVVEGTRIVVLDSKSRGKGDGGGGEGSGDGGGGGGRDGGGTFGGGDGGVPSQSKQVVAVHS